MLTLFLAYLDTDSDKQLFETIYLAYRKQMAALAFTLLHNKSDAEDVVSEVFLRIAQNNWETVRNITDQNDLRNYLLKAAKNASLNKIKAKSKENVFLDTVTEHNIDSLEGLADDTFLDTICDRFDYQNVLTAIRSLDQKYRDVLYYHFVLELTVPQTAKQLGQTLVTTKQQLRRGKKQLLELLGIKGDFVYGNNSK